MIHENLLQFIWKNKLLALSHFKTLQGNQGKLIYQGILNQDSGADFLNARIELDGIVWAGNIEIEVNSSSWFKHGHQRDESHRNTIMLVVYRNDTDLTLFNMPVLEISELLPENLLRRYGQMQELLSPLYCKNHLSDVDSFSVIAWLERMASERFEEKDTRIRGILQNNAGNWEQTFYQMLMRNFGFNLNAQPFEQLAVMLPFSCFSRTGGDRLNYEAFLFGASGLLNNAKSDYASDLKQRFNFFRKKYGLGKLPDAVWKFSKTHPANFPTLRMSQIADLLYKKSALFSKCIESSSITELISHFDGIVCSEFWNSHYHFSASAQNKYVKLGKAAINNILINTVIPVMFSYGKYTGNTHLCTRAFTILEQLPAENNRITRVFTNHFLPNSNALQSQSWHRLYTNYCTGKKCLDCGIGFRLLKNA